MKRTTKLAVLVTAIICGSSVVATAGNSGSNPGTHTAPTHEPSSSQPGPKASLPAKAKAYGRYCQNQSKTHLAGQKGTPFSQCVTAMAKLVTGKPSSPATACSAMSKKHVAGEKGTPFSRCVAAAAKLLKDQHR